MIKKNQEGIESKEYTKDCESLQTDVSYLQQFILVIAGMVI